MNNKAIIFTVIISFFLSCGQQNLPEENRDEASILTGDDQSKLEEHTAYTQNLNYENDRKYNTGIIAEMEKDRDTLAIRDFTEAYISKIFARPDFSYGSADLSRHIFMIDINDDGAKDVIYQGPSGGEPNMTVIFLNQDDRFVEVFRKYQDIYEIGLAGNKLSSFSLTNPGCCADPLVVDYFYEVTFREKQPTFNLTGATGYLKGYETPQNKFKQHIAFTILQEGSKLRNECYELDTEHPIYGESGNVLTTYQKGARGQALAEKSGSGKTWIYVLMDEKNTFDKKDFPTFMEQPTALYGWIKKEETDLK